MASEPATRSEPGTEPNGLGSWATEQLATGTEHASFKRKIIAYFYAAGYNSQYVRNAIVPQLLL